MMNPQLSKCCVIAALLLVGAAGASVVDEYFKAASRCYASNCCGDASIVTNYVVRAADSNDCQVADDDDAGVRWIRVPGLRNVRDIGGWTGLTLGRVYRGSELEYVCDEVSTPPLAATRNILVCCLGIRTELDLRAKEGRSKDKKGRVRHNLDEVGLSVRHVPTGSYVAAIDEPKAFAKALRIFVDEESFPVYVHCAGGADRTGTVVFLLEAICDVEEWKIDVDYELTTFAKIFGTRLRDDTGKLCYKTMKDRLRSEYSAASINGSVKRLCRERLGLTEDEIVRIRHNLMSGEGGQ